MARPLSGISSTSGASGLPRRVAAGVLFAGGALAFIATFLPQVYLTYPTTHGRIDREPEIPALVYLAVILYYRQYSNVYTPTVIAMCAWAFLLWGAPLILAFFGLALLLARRWTPGWRSWTVGVILVLLGAGYVLVSCLFFLNLQGSVVQVLTPGTSLSFLGYLAALVGVLWLALQRADINSA